MRQRVVCTGAAARYRVDVLRDGRLLRSDVIRGGGLRHDRQLYQFRELRVPAGRSLIEVRVSRLDSTTMAPGDDVRAATTTEVPEDGESADLERRELEARGRLRADEMPASLVLREPVVLAPREVMLVSYDRVAHRLRTVRGPPAATATGGGR
jgi:hypothetical protein